jgi:signal peptidase I
MADPVTPAKPDAKTENVLARLLRERPPAGAAAILGMLALPPLGVLMAALPEGWSGWCSASVVLASLALIPALAALLRFPWGNTVAQYLCWAEIVQVALRIVSKGFSPVQAVPGVIAIGVLLALTAAQPAPVVPPSDRRPDSMGQWTKENLEAIIVAFIMALVIRCFCIEVFKIPSSSMEPTLLGDVSSAHSLDSCPFEVEHQWSNGGDRIMVTKYYFAFSSIERYDVVVFKFPLNQSKNFIKRVVGLPDEELMIHRGNIFVKRNGESEFRVARRTLRTQDSIWITVDPKVDYLSSRENFGSPESKWKVLSPTGDGKKGDFTIDNRELVTLEKEKVRGIRFERRDRIDDGHDHTLDIADLQLAFDFELTSTHGALFAEIANEYGRFEAILSTDAVSELHGVIPGREEHAPLKDLKLVVDKRYHLALSVHDGSAVVRVNDEVVGHWDFFDLRKDEKITDSPDRLVAFGARDITFKVRNLTVGRDVYYKGKLDHDGRHIVEDEPVKIPPGSYIMMGDNVENSHDARSWSARTFLLTDGREIIAEAQDVENSRTISAEEVMERYGLKQRPTTIISADQYGIPWAIYSKTSVPEGFKPGPFVGILEEEKEQKGFHLVDEKFIVGKALWIWWPKGRWFHLIR